MDNYLLKNRVKNLPTKPGVYLFYGSKKTLYIGKAANLKNRINSYLKTGDSRIKKMIETAKTVKYLITSSDIEALILESQYIKKCRPMFNIMLRDDKQYFFVAFTKDRFSRIFLTHQIQNLKSKMQNIYVGPFTDGNAIKATLRYLRNIFPYCTCKQKHNNYCLNYHIGRCLGFCCLKDASNISYPVLRIYKRNIKAIKDILSGNKTTLIKKLEKEMAMQAKNGNFEEAIISRVKLEKLQKTFQNAQIIKEYKKREDALDRLKETLDLNKTPRRIESYDISNIQGINAAGSMVVFEDGKPNKNEYRKFKLSTCDTERKTVQIRSDMEMLKEVLIRRFKHSEWPFPDFIVVDGGKSQLNAAKTAISKEIPIIALTKNMAHKGEKITLVDRKSINLKDLPENVKNLILAIDSEAHRFAISYYRKLHRKRIM